MLERTETFRPLGKAAICRACGTCMNQQHANLINHRLFSICEGTNSIKYLMIYEILIIDDFKMPADL